MSKCKYCDYAENMNQTENQNFIAAINNEQRLFIRYNNSLAIDEVTIPVRHCPMCGRKLVPDDKEN